MEDMTNNCSAVGESRYLLSPNVYSMLGGIQIVPFHRPPKKEWKEGAEKKKRLNIDLTRDEDDEIEEEKFEEFVDDESESSEESEGYDMQQHIADLLPGDLVDGMKPTKQANMSHLMDLRVVAKPKERLGMFRRFYRFVQRKRAEERERRKHYILREWEAKIQQYDENVKKALLARIEAHRKEVLLEKHRSEQRRIRNSKKKVEKSAQIARFTTDLDRRDKEARVMQYYCENLTKWAMEGFDRQEAEAAEAKRIADELHEKKKAEQRVARHKQQVLDDAQVLEDDKTLTKQVETIMLRYGTVEYEPDLEQSHDEKLDDLFERHRVAKQKSDAAEQEGAVVVGDNANYMKITMKSDLDLVYLKKKLKKSVHKRTSTVPTPFVQDLSGTGQILSLKAIGISEAGALSLAAELTRGACPMLETLNLNGCQMRSDGIGRIFQGIKTANLLSIRTLQLKGNFIRAAGLEYMQEIFPSGVFMNLAVLDLGDNELRDDGAGVLVNIILQGFLMSIVDINLQHNSITDAGFFKIVSVMKSLKDAKCPLMERLRMENNLVSALTRRRNAPYPAFFSF